MSGNTFGELLYIYRRQAKDPQRGGGFTQDRLADLLSDELGIAYSRGAISEWERGRSQIHKDDRHLLVSLIKVLHQYAGIENLTVANEWLEKGNYRPLDQQECHQISPDWTLEQSGEAKDHLPLPGTMGLGKQRPLELQLLLKRVKTFWVEGVLEKSLYGEVMIELGKEVRPDAVDYPWEMVVQAVDQKPYTLSPKKTIVHVFDEANQSLLILGAPGSGKTTMLLDLARTTINRAEENDSLPVPVVFNLSSWTGQKPLAVWLVDELRQKYLIPRKIAQPWIDNDNLLLLLDGLDEVNRAHQIACVKAINDFRLRHLTGMVLCSRVEEYEAITQNLKLEVAIFLQPLTSQQIDEYLASGGQNLEAAHSLFNIDTTIRELAQSPLMLSIMTLAYQNISIKDLSTFDSIEARRQHLFAMYVQQMVKRRGKATRYSSTKMIGTLSWLAQQMRIHNQSVYLIENMQPYWLSYSSQRRQYELILGLVVGLLFGFGASLVVGLLFGLVAGLVVGLVVGLRFGEEIRPVEEVSWSVHESVVEWKSILDNSLRDGLGIGLIMGPVLGLSIGLVVAMDFGVTAGVARGLGIFFLILMFELIAGLVLGLFFGLLFALYAGLKSSKVGTKSRPNEGIQRSLRNALRIGLVVGMGIGLFIEPVAGLVIGFLVGLLVGGGLAVIQHFLLRFILYCHGYLPFLDLVDFLDYSVERIFLRKVGGGYIFVHHALMEYFSELDR